MKKTAFIFDNFIHPLWDESEVNPQNLMLRIELEGLKDGLRAYRDLSVPSNYYLGYLGDILVMAMGWANYHQIEIAKGKDTYRTPFLLNQPDTLEYDA